MSKDQHDVQGGGPGEGGRRASEAGPKPKVRFTARRKREAIMRLLKGEDLESLSRELQVPAPKLCQWRNDFLDAGMIGLMGQKQNFEEAYKKLQAEKIGDLTMENELLREKIRKMEDGTPFGRKRSRR